MFKIIGALLGFFATRSAVGLIIGFWIGVIIDRAVKSSKKEDSSSGGTYQRPFRSEQPIADDFASLLMILSAVVMRADGKVLKSELNFVKAFFQQQFGNQFSVKHLKVLKHYLNAPSIPLHQVCQHVNSVTREQDRLLLLHFLFGIANADGEVDSLEINEIQRIAVLLGLGVSDFEGIKNQFVRNSDSDYKILGLTESATDEEVKKAYRQLVLRYHPDRVLDLGEEYQKRARENFDEVQKAYENIKKRRGFS